MVGATLRIVFGFKFLDGVCGGLVDDCFGNLLSAADDSICCDERGRGESAFSGISM